MGMCTYISIGNERTMARFDGSVVREENAWGRHKGEANVLIKSRRNVETSPSSDVFAIFRKFRFSRAA